MSKVSRWEVDVIHEDSGEYMTVYLGEELWNDDDDLTEEDVIEIIMNGISIVPRFIGVDDE